MVKADGSRYCDMTGSGSDDYIVRTELLIDETNAEITKWVSPTGALTIFGNTHNWGTWTQYGKVYDVGRTRREVRLYLYVTLFFTNRIDPFC